MRKSLYPLSQAKDVLRFYREYTRTAPDELTAYVAITTTSHGLPTISISLCYCGPLAQGERLIERVRQFASPLADFVNVKPYLQAIASDAGAPNERCYYEKAYSLHEPSLLDEVEHEHDKPRVSEVCTRTLFVLYFALTSDSYT